MLRRRSKGVSGGVRLADVAQAIGVSETTVSRILRGKGPVAEPTRQKVLQTIQRLGYVPNRIAGALASAGTGLIAIIVPSFDNIVFADFLKGVTTGLAGTSFQPVIGVTAYDMAQEEMITTALLAWRPAGLIITGLEHTNRTIDILRASGVPVIETMDIDGEPVDAAIGISHLKAGAAMGRHLIDRGYARFAYIGHDLSRDFRARKRFEGFRNALSDNGLPTLTIWTKPAPSSVALGRAALAELLEASPSIDAVFFSNDDMAVGGYFHCIHAGIKVPKRLALAGFNGLAIGQAMPLRLASVLSPRFEIGERSAREIVARIGGAPGAERVTDLGFQLIPGETA